MHRLSILTATTVSLLVLRVALPAGGAVGQERAHQTSNVERVSVASQVFIAAIAARDIHAMDKVSAHEPYATFIGPLSTTIVVGWEGVRKAWEMRFSQFTGSPSRWQNRTFTPMGRSRGRSVSRGCDCSERTAKLSPSMPS